MRRCAMIAIDKKIEEGRIEKGERTAANDCVKNQAQTLYGGRFRFLWEGRSSDMYNTGQGPEVQSAILRREQSMRDS